jgi:mRNA-degrading endonuclease toxin of MazEF toxin-antitoxin module
MRRTIARANDLRAFSSASTSRGTAVCCSVLNEGKRHVSLEDRASRGGAGRNSDSYCNLVQIARCLASESVDQPGMVTTLPN